jgi:predicted flavoprotein YhiN
MSAFWRQRLNSLRRSHSIAWNKKHFIGEVVDVTGWLGGYNFRLFAELSG